MPILDKDLDWRKWGLSEVRRRQVIVVWDESVAGRALSFGGAYAASSGREALA